MKNIFTIITNSKQFKWTCIITLLIWALILLVIVYPPILNIYKIILGLSTIAFFVWCGVGTVLMYNKDSKGKTNDNE